VTGSGSADPPEEGFDRLAADLTRLFERGVDEPLDDRAFSDWALRVFRWQFATNAPYRGYCRARGVTPDEVARWEDVPPVPTSAFKRLRLLSVEEGRGPEVVFRTSGTSAGTERRGEHAVASLALYRAALLPPLRAHVLTGTRPRLLSLIPSAADAPQSSLSQMVGALADELGAEPTGWFARSDGSLAQDALVAAARAAMDERVPVLVATTAFALVHWLDGLARSGVRLRLPEGSRMMETGGFKGRARVVEREELYAAVEERLGIPAACVVNEYGMTELLSQFYEPVLSGPPAPAALRERFHVAPPWVRTRVLDPATLVPLGHGQAGLLCHFDLANAGSAACVLTEDMGVAVAGGFRLLGRAPGAEPRGCSLATEDLLRAADQR
jgi:hypothetical protein